MLPAQVTAIMGLLGIAAGVYRSAGRTCQEANEYFKKASGMFYWTDTRITMSYDSYLLSLCLPFSSSSDQKWFPGTTFALNYADVA